MAAGTKMVASVFRKYGECRAGWRSSPHCGDAHAEAETEEDGDSAQTRQRAGVQVAFLRGNGDQAVGNSEVANVPRQNERRQETDKEQSQTNKGQLRHLDTTGDYLIPYFYCEYGSETLLPEVNAMIPGD